MDLVFSERLRDRRKQVGMTATQLADVLQTSRSMLHSYETGKSLPSIELLFRVSEILDTTPNYLLGLTDDSRAIDPSPELSPLEQELIRLVRSKSPDQQSKILAMIKLL